MPAAAGDPAPRRRRSDGERSRTAILVEAGRLATVEGIEGVSIARLAQAVGISKSGLFAHFGSKEELQLATIEAAKTVFSEEVTEPSEHAPTGLDRLHALAENFLGYLERDTYPGGCFFASVATELNARPGPVRDRAAEVLQDYFNRLVAAIGDAQAEGAIDPGEDAMQLAFEIDAALLLANARYVIWRDRGALDRARRAIDRLIASAAP